MPFVDNMLESITSASNHGRRSAMEVVKTIKDITSPKYEGWKSQWQYQEGLDGFSYISDVVHPEDALMFCKVLLPDLVLHESGVFLEMFFTLEAYSSAMQRYDDDIVVVEQSMNHISLYDVFGGCRDRVDDGVYEQLGEIVAQSWRMLLKARFPERKFRVETIVSDQEYGPAITFCQLGK